VAILSRRWNGFADDIADLRCRPQGTVFGSGCGGVLYIFSVACMPLNDGDQIYAVIRASASTMTAQLKWVIARAKVEGYKIFMLCNCFLGLSMLDSAVRSLHHGYVEAQGTAISSDPSKTHGATQEFRSHKSKNSLRWLVPPRQVDHRRCRRVTG